MGSFVPAEKACLGVVDRLFARVGASDNVARHMSTFHMEMSETANILTNATSNSFVILDEIGMYPHFQTLDHSNVALLQASLVAVYLTASSSLGSHPGL